MYSGIHLKNSNAHPCEVVAAVLYAVAFCGSGEKRAHADSFYENPVASMAGTFASCPCIQISGCVNRLREKDKNVKWITGLLGRSTSVKSLRPIELQAFQLLNAVYDARDDVNPDQQQGQTE